MQVGKKVLQQCSWVEGNMYVCMYYVNGKLDEEVTCTTNIHTTLMQKAFFSFKKTAHFFLALSHG